MDQRSRGPQTIRKLSNKVGASWALKISERTKSSRYEVEKKKGSRCEVETKKVPGVRLSVLSGPSQLSLLQAELSEDPLKRCVPLLSSPYFVGRFKSE